MTFDPKHGPTTGNTPVLICGGPWDEETLEFTTVMFGECEATNIEFCDVKENTDDYKTYTSIKATSPPQSAGDVPIKVITPGDSYTEKDTFTYEFEVCDVQPPHAKVPKEGNPVFVIIGGNDLANVDAVEFVNQAEKVKKRARFGLIDPTHIWAEVPYFAPGKKVIVQVKTPHGTNKDKPTFNYDNDT